jgi:putative membrane protein
MDWTLLLAGAHHLAVFSLVGVFAAEFALIRPGLEGRHLPQLGRLDAAYGALAMLVVVVGVARVWVLGPDYYLGNHAFWGKMLAFIAVGLLSIQPTLAIRRWRKAEQAMPGTEIPAGDIAKSRRFVHLEAAILVLIPLFAAAMAQGYGS